MRLYSGSSQQFITDAIHNQIADKLKTAFFSYYRFNPSPNEVNSWRNSLRAISQVFQHAELNDHGVLLEYQLPLTSKRLDCMICGKDEGNRDHAVIIELKQWDSCSESNSANEVVTWVGGAHRDILHPSVQVGQYQQYLSDVHTAFHEGVDPVVLQACSYLHNYGRKGDDVIFDAKFRDVLEKYPLFTCDDVDPLKEYLVQKLIKGMGLDVLKRVEQSRYQPSKKLMDHVGNVIKGSSEYILLDEQLVVYDKVIECVESGFKDRRKNVLIVRGGPGTGKSVIAINLMADLLLKGHNSHYATGSKAFTETLRKIIGARGAPQFRYFNSYVEADPNEIDVLIADESHRIRKTSNDRYRPGRSKLEQIDELLRVGRVCVFFIDDDQVVRPDEVGSSCYIRTKAESCNAKVYDYELEAQFRCSGSDAFVNWINNTLGIKKTANVIWDQHDVFDFKIFATPDELEKAIRKKSAEGSTARLTAGFCWKWSKEKANGTLEDDVVIGDYRRPWNAKHDAKRLAPGIPKAHLWAYDSNGINQIGCVYTAQGFEFDYVGVIFGNDLRYDFDGQTWIGDRAHSADNVVKRSKDQFLELVKNTYRVLLSRGMKGCYVHFMDKDTERFIKSRIEDVEMTMPEADVRKIRLVSGSEISKMDKFTRFIPLYSLKVAAGKFIENESVFEEGWVKIPKGVKPSDRLFVAKIAGHSMEPLIPDGSYGVFRFGVEGSRQGKIVLVQHSAISDPETGASYTVKRYRSEKKTEVDGSWQHGRIILESLNTAYPPIILNADVEEEMAVVAEWCAVI